MKMKRLPLLALIILLTGCAGKLDYIRPDINAKISNEKTVDRPREQVWNSAVPALGKEFFVINNLDKSSGLINVSYSGDPEKFIDCGQISSHVSNLRGERTYSFPGAAASKQYEMMNDGRLFIINRKMELEGRVNLIFEEISPTKTKVTANTRYIVKRHIVVQNIGGGFPVTNADTLAFNTGASASFPAAKDGRATECVGTGKLEAEILKAIN